MTSSRLEELAVEDEATPPLRAPPPSGASVSEEWLRHYRDLFEGAPDGYALTDARGTIVEANRALVAMLGVHSRFLDRKPLLNFVARGDVRAFRAALAGLARGEGDGEIVSIRLRPRHGEAPFLAEVVPRVVRAADRVTSIRWGVRRAPSRAPGGGPRARGEPLASAVHDLRSLVHAVHASGAALARELGEGPAGPLALLGAIERPVARLLHLAGDLDDAALLDAGKLALAAKEVDARALLDAVVDAQRPLADERGVRLRKRRPEAPLFFRGDPERVERVLANLVDPAVQVTPRGSEVVVSLEAAGGGVRFMVRDSGPGLGSEELRHVFDRDWRAPGAASPSPGRLGLAIASEIAEAHGGHLEAHSVPGDGTTFALLLPRRPHIEGGDPG